MEQLRVTEIYRDVQFTLLAIESIDLQRSYLANAPHLTGSLKPLAIIVNSRHGSYAFDMDANPLVIDTLRRRLPELDTLLS